MATLWVLYVISAIELVILVLTLALGLTSFVHCLTQRSDSFPAIGTLSKPAWLGLIGVSLLLSLLFRQGGVGLFGLIATGIALVYLLDVRPALRDVADGRGSW